MWPGPHNQASLEPSASIQPVDISTITFAYMASYPDWPQTHQRRAAGRRGAQLRPHLTMTERNAGVAGRQRSEVRGQGFGHASDGQSDAVRRHARA